MANQYFKSAPGALPVLISLALFGAPPVMAEDSDETTEVLSDRISVTAERGRERETMEVPQAVDTITRLDLDEQLPIDLTQAIQRQPSVGRQPQAGRRNPCDQRRDRQVVGLWPGQH